MLFLKCLKKIIVFPVVVMIGFLWLITKILVSLYGVAHGMLGANIVKAALCGQI